MNKTIILIFFTILSTVFPQLQPKGNLEGTILDKNTKLPLLGVNIYIINNGKGTTSDEKGAYLFKDLTVGTYTIQFSYIGYEKVTKTDIIIKPKRTTYLNLEMLSSAIELENVVVESGYFAEIENQPIGTVNFSSEEVRRAPGSAGDVSRILFGLPSLGKSK